MPNKYKDKIYKLLDLVSKYTNDEKAYITVVCGINNEDIDEFIEFIKLNEDNIKNFNDFLEGFITFRNMKNYKNDDVEEC